MVPDHAPRAAMAVLRPLPVPSVLSLLRGPVGDPLMWIVHFIAAMVIASLLLSMVEQPK
jgi:hypothetical protein